LLGGKPKQGKSWFALALALTIAAGSTILDTYQATQGEVLFLGLEDTERRLQARSKQLLSGMSTVPSGIEFATQWPTLDEGGLAQLEAYIQAHPRLRCIVIDTWAKVAPHMKGRSQYEEDYAALSPLKQLADTYHLSILAIHHLRKTQAHDVLDEIIGSTAIIGVVDGIFILKRERAEDQHWAEDQQEGAEEADDRLAVVRIPVVHHARHLCPAGGSALRLEGEVHQRRRDAAGVPGGGRRDRQR